MERMPICRICLVENVPMYIVADKNLHELYETLTDIPFVTEDRRPMLTCYFCFAKLKQCSQLQRKCLEAEELFVQMMSEPNTLVNRSQLGFFSGLTKTPVEIISIIDVGQIESIAVKEEIPTVCERLDDVIEPKEEHQSDELELENLNNSYTDIEDMPAPQSSSEDGPPLIEIKKEVEEQKEKSRKKRSASDTRRSPIAKKSKLNVRGRNVKDVITEEQKDQTDTEVIQNARNCTSQLIPEFKEPLTYIKPGVNISIINTTLDSNCRENNKRYKKSKIPNEGVGSNDINRHRNFCFKGNRFKCEICHSDFNRKLTLIKHLRIHTGEKPFKCDICQRRFNDKQYLKEHIRIHTGEKPFKCHICQLCFSQQGHLTRHIRTHTSEKPFKCHICQRCFGQKDYLTTHIRTHTSEKPFKCHICQRCFSQKSHLTTHIRSHTSEKPFKCDVCERCFSMKHHLTHHIRTHTGEISI